MLCMDNFVCHDLHKLTEKHARLCFDYVHPGTKTSSINDIILGCIDSYCILPLELSKIVVEYIPSVIIVDVELRYHNNYFVNFIIDNKTYKFDLQITTTGNTSSCILCVIQRDDHTYFDYESCEKNINYYTMFLNIVQSVTYKTNHEALLLDILDYLHKSDILCSIYDINIFLQIMCPMLIIGDYMLKKPSSTCIIL